MKIASQHMDKAKQQARKIRQNAMKLLKSSSGDGVSKDEIKACEDAVISMLYTTFQSKDNVIDNVRCRTCIMKRSLNLSSCTASRKRQ